MNPLNTNISVTNSNYFGKVKQEASNIDLFELMRFNCFEKNWITIQITEETIHIEKTYLFYDSIFC